MMSKNAVLNAEQKARLEALEAVISKGQSALFEMSAALLEIEREELWKPEHQHMADYCWRRWDMSASEKSRFLDAARAIEALTKKEMTTLPTNVSQAYDLWQAAGKDAAACVRLWKKVLAYVVKNPETRISAKLIKELAGKKATAKKEAKQSILDSKVNFRPILEGLQGLDAEIPRNQITMKEREELREQVKKAKELLARIEKQIG